MILRPVAVLDADVVALAEAGIDEGHGFCERFIEEWRSGLNRFDREGELFLVGVVADGVVAMGGLNRDPFTTDPGIGRVRRLYVAADERRHGIGRRVVGALVDHARVSGFHAVRLRTYDPAAASFYGRLGFEPSSEPAATHRIELDRR